MKKCNKCDKNKPLKEFVKNKQCKNGLAGTCKQCQNSYSKKWKQERSKELSEKRRKIYAETQGVEVKRREEKRKQLYPLRVRCQLLRSGMRERCNNKRRNKKCDFDSNFFTVKYLMDRLLKNPYCECCGKRLDIEFKKDKKFNDNSPSMDRVNSSKGYTKDNVAILCWRCNKHKQDSTSKELRMIADFMDSWGNEIKSDIKL